MRVLVTGSDGFVGRALCEELNQRGHSTLALRGPHAEHYAVDITKGGDLESHCNRERPEVVVHLAAQSSVGHSWVDPIGTTMVNTVGTLNVWKAAARWVRRFIYVSSAHVYERHSKPDEPLTEFAPCSPSTPYGTTKLAAELLLTQISVDSGVELVILRPFNLIGPNQPLGFVVADLASQIVAVKRGKAKVIQSGDLQPTRDFLDVRDAVRAYADAVEGPSVSGVFNVCSGVGRSIQTVLKDLMVLWAVDAPIEARSQARKNDYAFMVGDFSKIKAFLGWQPEKPWSQTLFDILSASDIRLADADE